MTLLKHVLFVSLLWMGSAAIAQQKNSSPPADAGQKKEAVRDTRPKDFVVNPKLCKRGDKKYIYWATEQKVFRFRYDPEAPLVIKLEPYWSIATELAAQSIPPAPDPTEAIGCYLNPIRAGDVPYLFDKSKTIFRKIFGRDRRSGMGPHGFGSNPSPTFETNRVYMELSQQAQICRARSKNVSECLTAPKGDMDDPENNRIVQIKKESVSKLLKEDIYAGLRYEVSRSSGLSVRSGFHIFDSIRIDTSFRIFLGEVDKLEDYFRALISELESARVENYRWTK